MVVGNLLPSAFTFTLPRTNVTLRVGASPERSVDRTGVGVGLESAKWEFEANDGHILHGRERANSALVSGPVAGCHC
jgi:hypothetical protein